MQRRQRRPRGALRPALDLRDMAGCHIQHAREFDRSIAQEMHLCYMEGQLPVRIKQPEAQTARKTALQPICGAKHRRVPTVPHSF